MSTISPAVVNMLGAKAFRSIEAFEKAVSKLPPRRAQFVCKELMKKCAEDGEKPDIMMAILSEDVLYGYLNTPFGAISAMKSFGKLINIDFLGDEDIKLHGNLEKALEMTVKIVASKPNPKMHLVRDDQSIGRSIQSALDGNSEFLMDFFEHIKNDSSTAEGLVWTELLVIPYGETIAFEDLVKRFSGALSEDEVGTALKGVTYPILIPSHRVTDEDGKREMYPWGDKMQKALIKYEKENNN